MEDLRFQCVQEWPSTMTITVGGVDRDAKVFLAGPSYFLIRNDDQPLK